MIDELTSSASEPRPAAGLAQRIADILGPAAKARPRQTAAQDRAQLIEILNEHHGSPIHHPPPDAPLAPHSTPHSNARFR